MVTASSGAPFTWDSADFAWQDAAAGKTWLTAHTAAYTLAPAETLALRTAYAHTPHCTASETMHLTASHARSAAHLVMTALTAAAALTAQTDYRRTAETVLSAREAHARSTCRTARASVSVTDSDARRLEARHTAPLSLTVTHAPHTACRRTFGETITAAVCSTRRTERTEHDHLSLADAYLTPWQGILSNITLLAGGLPEEAWQSASASPSGYAAFHPFEVGEYTYRDALVRILLTTGAAGTDPLLCDVRFHVDIEDTRESGTADCTAEAPTRITLTRRFFHTPRIVLTVLGASGDDLLIPRLVGQSEESGTRTFDCELVRTDGTRTSGTIAWLAEGY